MHTLITIELDGVLTAFEAIFWIETDRVNELERHLFLQINCLAFTQSLGACFHKSINMKYIGEGVTLLRVHIE